jgi:vacuolar-type H+-ATPase subunit E/Vma4
MSQIEQSHTQYLGVGNILKLAQPEFCDKLVRALSSRLRVVNEAAMSEVERWSKGAGAQLDAQLKERRRNFGKRIEAVDRIQQAAGNLEERLVELSAQEAGLVELHRRLRELTSLLTSNEPPSASAAQNNELRAA